VDVDEQRLELAEEFLREAVRRSRESGALDAAWQRATSPGRGSCGLGERAAIELELSERGRELFEVLWPDGGRLGRVRAVMRAWIEEQDALDRKRNHFLKAFRNAHGFDRTRYTPAQTAEYDAGLCAINGDEDQRRRAAARALFEP
jgi:hypothetical protein